MSDVDVKAATAELETAATALAAAIDPERKTAAVTKEVKEFEDPAGKWFYTSADIKNQKRREAEAMFDEGAGMALVRAHDTAQRLGPALDAAAERHREAPSPNVAWLQRTHGSSLSGSELLQLGILDELRLARVSRELDQAMPTKALGTYLRALEDPTEQANATTIRVIEGRYARGWQGLTVDTKNRAEAEAVQELHRRISQSRDARVPTEVKTTQARVASLRLLMQRATELHKVRPVRPR
jgi:uncharacterized protein YchJ